MTGAGTEADPYVIWTAQDLQDIQKVPTAWYELGQDIDCLLTDEWNGGEGFVPIGYGAADPGPSKPAADHSQSGTWVVYPASPATFYDKVDEDTADDDSTYIEGRSVGAQALFTLEPWGFSHQSWCDLGLAALWVKARAKRIGGSAANIRMTYRVDGVDYIQDYGTNLATFYADVSMNPVTINPATSLPWTLEDLLGTGPHPLQAVGIRAYSLTGGSYIRCTRVWAEIGPSSYDDFVGQLDGKGYEIKHLHIDMPAQDTVALFANAWDSARLRNFGLANAYIRGESWVGGIVGFLYDDVGLYETYGPMAKNVWVRDSEIRAVYGFAGGFAASTARKNKTDVVCEDCYVKDTIVADEDDYSDGWLGGFVNVHDTGTLQRCYTFNIDVATFVSTESYSYLYGGFVAAHQGGKGTSGSVIKQCFSHGSVRGKLLAGGFAGEIGYNADSDCLDCYSWASAETINDYDPPSAYVTAAGFVSYAYPETATLGYGANILRCYAIGFVKSNGIIGSGEWEELVGFGWEFSNPPYQDAVIEDCFCDMDVNGCSTPGDATGLTTLEAKTRASYPTWNFDAVWDIHPR